MIAALISVIGSALSIWNSKEKRRYLDKWMHLKRSYDGELNKPDHKRDNAVLDDIEFELMLLGNAFSEKVRAEKTGDL